MKNFVVFHQPKTGGTFIQKSLGSKYVLPHHLNYNFCINNNYDFSDCKLVCIIRNPLDYYISCITFWCLDSKYNNLLNTPYRIRLQKWEKNKDNLEGHPSYWISRGYTESKLNNILNNLFDRTFLGTYSNRKSKKFHTYDYKVFAEMERLDIGFYTFCFLDQYSRKKIDEIKIEECRDEILWIKNNFKILETSKLSSQIDELCQEYRIPYNKIKPQMKSNRKSIKEYQISPDIIRKIKYSDRYIYEIFFTSI